MKRIKDEYGIVHFAGMTDSVALCSHEQDNLLGIREPMPTTCEPVSCAFCATLYCRIKNAPWNEVNDQTMEAAIYAAVKE